MLRYVVHRLLVMVPTLVAISIIMFIIIQLPPGDYLTTMLAELQSQGEGAQPARSTICASSTASTGRCGSSISTGPGACCTAISATRSSMTGRWPR